MNSRHRTLTLLALAASALSVAAQTAAKPAATHTAASRRTAAAPAASSASGGGCLTLPPISPKIPALPAGSACPKPLYTLTRKPDISLDYVSPMVSTELRDQLRPQTTVVSLGYVDTKIGSGPLAQPNKFYTVHYTGYLAADGSKFDSSVDRGKPISFPYGGHRVIPGWDTGFEGMHVGGKRRLFIPYQLAYGDQGHPPAIPAKSMLVFDLELIAQNDADPDAQKAPAPVSAQPSGASSTPAPAGQPATSPAGAAATPPVTSSTPTSSTQPATKPEAK